MWRKNKMDKEKRLMERRMVMDGKEMKKGKDVV